MFFNNLFCLVGGHLNVGDLFFSSLIDFNYGLKLAETCAAGLGYTDFVSKICVVNLFNKCVENRTRACRNTAGLAPIICFISRICILTNIFIRLKFATSSCTPNA